MSNNNTDKIVSLSGLSRAVTRIREWVESLTHPLTIKYRDNKNQLHEVFVDGSSTQTIDLSKGLYYSDTCGVATRVSNPLSIVNGNEKMEWRGNDHVGVDVRSMRPLYIRNSGSEIVVEDENNQIVDSIQVEQGQFIPSKVDMNITSTICKPGTQWTQVYCANRNGVIGGTNLNVTSSSVSSKLIKDQTLKLEFVSYVGVTNTTTIIYAKFNVVEAKCTEKESLVSSITNTQNYCYLRANTFNMYNTTTNIAYKETIIVRAGDSVYIPKSFLDEKININPNDSGHCYGINYYDLFGGEDVSKGELYVQVTYKQGKPMIGVNIVCDDTCPSPTTTDEYYGGINYCTTGCIDKHYVIHLDKIYDMIVNDIYDEEHQLLTDKIDIVLPEWLSRDYFRSIKFVDCNVPDNNVFNFSIQAKDGDQVPVIEYEKVDGLYTEVEHRGAYPFESINGSSVDIRVIKITPSGMGMEAQWAIEPNTYL